MKADAGKLVAVSRLSIEAEAEVASTARKKRDRIASDGLVGTIRERVSGFEKDRKPGTGKSGVQPGTYLLLGISPCSAKPSSPRIRRRKRWRRHQLIVVVRKETEACLIG